MHRIAVILSALFGQQGQLAQQQSRRAARWIIGIYAGAAAFILIYLLLGVLTASNPHMLSLQVTVSFLLSLLPAYICGALAAWQGASGGPRWWTDNGMARPGGTPLDDRIYRANPDPFPPLYNARITTMTATIIIVATIAGSTPAMIWPLHLLALMAAMAYGFSRYASAYHGRVMRPAMNLAGIFTVFAFLLEWAIFLLPKASGAAAIKAVQTDGDLASFILNPQVSGNTLLVVLVLAVVFFLIWRRPQVFSGLGTALKWVLIIALILSAFVVIPYLLRLGGTIGTAQASTTSANPAVSGPAPGAAATLDASNSDKVLIGKIGEDGKLCFRVTGTINFGTQQNNGPLGSSWHTGARYGDPTRRPDLPTGCVLVQVDCSKLIGLSELKTTDEGGFIVTGRPGTKVYALINESTSSFGDNAGTFSFFK